MKKYRIDVSYGEKGYLVFGGIFKIIIELLRNPKAKYITINIEL